MNAHTHRIRARKQFVKLTMYRRCLSVAIRACFKAVKAAQAAFITVASVPKTLTSSTLRHQNL